MANNVDQASLERALLKPQKSAVIKIISKLAGEESNLKISLKELTFNIGGSKLTLNGEVNFDVLRAKEEIQ